MHIIISPNNMSFNRPLTGQSQIYATVALNTNVCANSVSTVYLSATNASFTNITTNAWTAGNVSTANVIATDGYFGNLNISNLNISILTTSQGYITNLSSSRLDVPNISTLQTINGATTLRIANNGGLIVKDRDTSDASLIQLNYASTPSVETYGLYLEANKAYGRVGAGQNCSLQFYADTVLQAENTSTTGWRFYSSMNSSYRNNFSNISVSNLSAITISSTSIIATNISVNTLAITNLSVSSVSAFGVSVGNVCATYAYVSFVACLNTFYNMSRDIYGDLYVISQQTNSSHLTKPSLRIDGTNISYFVYTFDGETIKPFTIGVSGVSVSNISCTGAISAISASFTSDISTVQNVYASQYIIGQSGSTAGSIYESNNRLAIISNSANTSGIYIQRGGNIIFDINNTGINVGDNFYINDVYPTYISTGYFSNVYTSALGINTLSANTANLTNMNATTTNSTNVNASTANICTTIVLNLNASNGNISNLTTSVANFSQLNASSQSITTTTASTVNTTTLNVSTANASTTNICTANTLNLNASNGNISNLTTSVANFSQINASSQNILTVTSSTLNTVTLNASTANASTANSLSLNVSNANICNVSIKNIYNLSNISTIERLRVRSYGIDVRSTYTSIENDITFKYDHPTQGEIASLRIEGGPLEASLTVGDSVSAFKIITGSTLLLTNVSTIGWSFYSSIFVSKQLNTSNISGTNLSLTAGLSAINASITNLSATNFTADTFALTNLSIQNLSVSSALTATSATITRLQSTSMFVSNLSTSNISTSGRLTVLNISVNAISADSRISADNLRVINNIVTTNGSVIGIDVNGVTGNFSNINISLQVNSSTVSTALLIASNTSIVTATGSTVNFSTGNFSNLAFTNAVVNMCVSSLFCSSLVFATNGTASQYGAIQYGTGRMIITSTGATADRLTFANSGNIRFEISTNGASSYVPFYASSGNFSTLAVSTFSPNNINTGTMTATTVNGTTGNFSNLNASNFNPATINSTTGNFSTLNSSVWNLPSTVSFSTINACDCNICNISTSYFSSFLGNVTLMTTGALYSDIVSLKSPYDNPSLSWNTSNSFAGGRMGPDFTTKIFDLTIYDFNLSDFNLTAPRMNVCIPTINFCNGSGNLVALMDMNTCKFSISNANISNISVYNLSASMVTGYIAGTLYDNDFKCVYASSPMKLHVSSINTCGAGIRVPNYIDAIDTGTGMTIGANQTAGFINCCRSTRVYGNVVVEGNVNSLDPTVDLGLGVNLTSGNLDLGNTTMTGNISIDTTGDVVFGCDRRSTWNTSNLIKNSTQLGSFYQQIGNMTANKTSTGITYVYGPNNANTSLTTLPVGLYLVSGSARIKTFSGYNASTQTMNIGTCYGNTYNFTTGTTTRTSFINVGTINTSGTNNFNECISFSTVFNMSITGQYLGVFMSLTANQAATVGSVDLIIDNVTVTKIA